MANEKWVADARELLIEIERIYEDHYSKSYDQCVHDIFNAMRRIVRRNATFRAVEVVHGRWIVNVEFNNGERVIATCSNCRDSGEVRTERNEWGIWHIDSLYCPNCGAKMDGDGNA